MITTLQLVTQSTTVSSQKRMTLLNSLPSAGHVIAAASASASAAAASASAAEAARDVTYSSAQSSGVYIYDTKALADAAVAGLANLSIVEVMNDESQAGLRTRYRKESGLLVLKLTLEDAARVKFSDGLAPAYLKSVSDIINGSEISILRFISKTDHASILDMTSAADLSARFQDAFSAGGANGIHLMIPRGKYNLPSQVRTFHDNVSLRGAGKPLMVVGAGQAAGYVMFAIYNSGFSASGMKIQTANRTHCFYIQPPSAAPLSGFRFENIDGDGLFYLVRGDGAADRYINDAIIMGCKNTAPIGANSGHFMFDHSDGVKYIGNTIVNGYNTSGFGLADSRNFAVIGNVERSLQDSAAATEAACQIEDSDGANGVISGNSFQHDIWVAGSNGVEVSGNSCRRMRLSVGNTDGYDVYDVGFSANKAAQIHVDKFTSGTPAERISASFIGNRLSPAGRTLNGVALSSLAYLNGAYISEIKMRDNKALSDASTYALDINRSAGAVFRMFDNDWGTKAHDITGATAGLVYERGNRNGLYKTGGGYVDAYISTTFSIGAGAWQSTVLNSTSRNVNGEWSGAAFTPVESGTYRFSGIMTVDPDAAGSQAGFRLYRTSGTPAELARLAFARAADANSMGVALRTVDVYLTAGDVIELQHFFTGATTQFVTGSTVTSLQVVRIA